MAMSDWRQYNDSAKPGDFPMGPESANCVEFLAGEDAPSGLFKKGDVVRGHPLLMNCSLFSHWRPVDGDQYHNDQA